MLDGSGAGFGMRVPIAEKVDGAGARVPRLVDESLVFALALEREAGPHVARLRRRNGVHDDGVTAPEIAPEEDAAGFQGARRVLLIAAQNHECFVGDNKNTVA